jgi:hypothetical protein
MGIAPGSLMVVRAGCPSAEEALAVLLALDTALRADTSAPRPSRPAWVAAARQEALGGRAAASRSDLGGWG